MRARGTPADSLLALSLSFTAHVLVSWFGLQYRPPAAAEARAPTPVVEIEVDRAPEAQASEGPGRAAEPRRAEPWSGGEATARPDRDRAGRGGSDEVSLPAVNLAPRDDRAHLSPEIRSRLERAQEARTRTGGERRSPEDDRVSPDPMLLTFVADGSGRSERRRPAVEAGGATEPVREAPRDGHEPAEARAPRPAKSRVATAAELAVKPAHARPMTVRGGESSPADERGEPQDDVDAEQEVMALERSWLRASTAGGKPGAGPGGQRGEGAPGAGGDRGPGSRSAALGSGPGRGIDPHDARRRRYLRRVFGKIDGSWSARDFPREAALAGKQGYAIVSFVIQADGRVRDVRLARPSGFPEFDARMLRAVERAAPFGPLPPELGPAFRHQHHFVVSNPAVTPPHRR